MSSNPRRNVSLPTGKEYHFNVIYNNAKSKQSRTDDTELSLEVTKYFIEQAKGWGYDLSYYVGRDALSGHDIFSELFHVIKSSMYTIVILTNEFSSNWWAQYCQQSAFKTLLESTGSDPSSKPTSRLIPVLVNVPYTEIQRLFPNLVLNKCVSFTKIDWRTDKEEWDKVRQMMKDPKPIPRHPIQETEPPDTRATHSVQAEDTPSLSQFNRPPPETDGPRASNVTRLESRNLSNDMPSVGQSRSSKVIPPGDISGNLSQNPPGSAEETYLKQLANTVTTEADHSTRSTPFSDSGIGSPDTTPGPSFDFFSSPQEEISAVLQTKSHCETTLSNQISAPPITQITKKDGSQDFSGTPTSQLPGHMSDSEARTSISFNRNEGMSGTGKTTITDRILDSIGSMQNQSDLDLDHGSLPSRGGPTAVLNAKSQRDPTSPKGDHSDQTSTRGDNSDESPVAIDPEHISILSLSSSTHPIEDRKDFMSNRYEQLVSDKEETITQKLSEFGKSEEVCRKSGAADLSAGDSPIQSGSKPEGGTDLQKNGDNKLLGASGPLVNSLTNGKQRTRRASMSDLARPVMRILGNWILKPALHVYNVADQLYI